LGGSLLLILFKVIGMNCNSGLLKCKTKSEEMNRINMNEILIKEKI